MLTNCLPLVWGHCFRTSVSTHLRLYPPLSPLVGFNLGFNLVSWSRLDTLLPCRRCAPSSYWVWVFLKDTKRPLVRQPKVLVHRVLLFPPKLGKEERKTLRNTDRVSSDKPMIPTMYPFPSFENLTLFITLTVEQTYLHSFQSYVLSTEKCVNIRHIPL